MPRYFFDMHDERTTSHDTNGILRADREAASATANRILAEIAADEPLRRGRQSSSRPCAMRQDAWSTPQP